LAGKWRVAPDVFNTGTAEKWYEKGIPSSINNKLSVEIFYKRDIGEQPEYINLPGTDNDGKLGKQLSYARRLSGGLERLYAYDGVVWFEKEIIIPENWRGKSVQLFMERVPGMSKVWFDGIAKGERLAYAVPHLYEILPSATPGKHKITVMVNNNVKLESYSHHITPGSGARWNGIIGKIELQAENQVTIKSIQIYPDIKHKKAVVKIRIKNGEKTQKNGNISLYVHKKGEAGIRKLIQKTELALLPDSTQSTETEITIPEPVVLWDDFNPALYELETALNIDGKTVDNKTTSFGMRSLKHDKQFILNDQPIFLRGTLDCGQFPLKADPAMDKESWLDIYRVYQQYGLNHVRFHTWCPPEAAFEAADEAGVIIQIETASPPYTELPDILDYFGNHPSFALVSLHNEKSHNDLTRSVIRKGKEQDPRHLYCCTSHPYTPGCIDDFYVSAWGVDRKQTVGIQWGGADVVSVTRFNTHHPETASDYSTEIERINTPLVSHEVGQWAVYPDLSEIPEYNGLLRNLNYERIREDLSEKGLLSQAQDFTKSSGMLSLLLYKEEIESAMRTPHFGGFQLLDIHDFQGQEISTVGILNAFWKSKGLITPEGFREFCSPAVPLFRMEKRVWTQNEIFEGTAELSYFGVAVKKMIHPVWRICDEKGNVLLNGKLENRQLSARGLFKLGKIKASFNKLLVPAKLQIIVEIPEIKAINRWDFWLYPEYGKNAVEDTDVQIYRGWGNEVKEALRQGKKVLLFPKNEELPGSRIGCFTTIFWNPLMKWHQIPHTMGILCDPEHPVFEDFPTDFHSNWQWWYLTVNSRVMNLDKLPSEIKPLVQVVDNMVTNQKLGYLFECKSGEGKLIVCSVNIDSGLVENPVARQFRKSLLEYMKGDKFAPQNEMNFRSINSLFGHADESENEEPPRICYWFFSPELFENDKYLTDIDSIAGNTLFNFVFLTAREGADFYDYKQMKPILKKLVAHAHEKGIKVGLQLWDNTEPAALSDAQRMVLENEIKLDASGKAKLTAKARYFRFPEILAGSDLLKVYAFRKTKDVFYEKNTFKDITDYCQAESPNKETVNITINGGKELSGYTAYILTQHYISRPCKYSEKAVESFTSALKAYADIPFDGFALDEYGSKYIKQEHVLAAERDTFSGRWYSPPMAEAYKKVYNEKLETLLFDMRYAPSGRPEVTMRAINRYMDFMRGGALRVEKAVCKSAKEIFGNHIFTGVHNTFHNKFTNDEIWVNGLTWWTIPREYGHSDEYTYTPTQMGIAMAYPANAMYNMFYQKDIEKFTEKVLTDLRYGIRTHYHALNDRDGWGVSLEKSEVRPVINRIEKCAALMNRFNPSLPEIRLLVVFGAEALSNWYPNKSEKGLYNINDKLFIEEKALEIWKKGYLNALVPSDLIVNKTITVSDDGKAMMNGHCFDAVVYLYPQYAREEVIAFLEKYLSKGGKLMIEGKATHHFNGDNISARFAGIFAKAAVRGFDTDKIAMLGLEKNLLANGCKNEDGSYIFTDINSLRTGSPASFTVECGNKIYQGKYCGIVLFKADSQGEIEKLEATDLKELIGYDDAHKMVTTKLEGWNYHTDAESGTFHEVRASLNYAADLLATDDLQYRQRAFDIIGKCISLQDTDTASKSCGVWPYYEEEPLATKKSPVDYNWADFNAATLLGIYLGYKRELPAGLLKEIENSIILAANSIRKRNVSPGYTNIAIMGTYVTYLTSTLFDIPEMKEYATARLKRFYDYTLEKNGFLEYNSPTYTMVALNELNRMQQHISEPEVREMIDSLYATGWKIIATHYHKPTGQWAGPHSRAYSALVNQSFYDILNKASGGKIIIGNNNVIPNVKFSHHIPEYLLPFFLSPNYPRLQKDVFENNEPQITGTCYLTDIYAISSISRSSMWNQRHPLIAYWGTVEKPSYLQVRLLHNMYDFSAATFFSAQKDNTVLSGINFATDGGDKHINIDILKNGKFKATDLRLRFEFGNISADRLAIPAANNASTTFIIDGVRFGINLFFSTFGDYKGYWKKGSDNGKAWIDYIIYSGKEKEIDLMGIDKAALAFTLSVSKEGDTYPENDLKQSVNEGIMNGEWNGLKIALPLKPAKKPSNL
jgi:hypothetical protein